MNGLAAYYPWDINIESHPAVLFVERFNDPVSVIVQRWGDAKAPDQMALVKDVPFQKPAGASLQITAGNGSTGGHLYKVLTPGVQDTLFVRYYIKYPKTPSWAHSGVSMGGYNPISSWPDPQAGVKPNGDDRFIAGIEPNTQAGAELAIVGYDYWQDMRPDGLGTYWGNLLQSTPPRAAPLDTWMCVEHMVKLNNPVTGSNGSHAFWIDGEPVIDCTIGNPLGSWSGGRFTEDPAGQPFEGFRWRSTPALPLNWIWLQHYSPSLPAGETAAMLFYHVVVATSYIGPIGEPPKKKQP